jgi:hypothetical protein
MMLRFHQSRYLFLCSPDFQNVVKRAGIIIFFTFREWREREGGRVVVVMQKTGIVGLIYHHHLCPPGPGPRPVLRQAMLNNRGMKRGYHCDKLNRD